MGGVPISTARLVGLRCCPLPSPTRCLHNRSHPAPPDPTLNSRRPRLSPAARSCAPAARLIPRFALQIVRCRVRVLRSYACGLLRYGLRLALPRLGGPCSAVQCRKVVERASERSTRSAGGQSPAWAAEAQPVRAGRMAAEYADGRPRRIGRAGSRAAWYPLRFGACGVRPVRHGHPVRSRPPHEAWSELCPLLRMWHGLSAARVVLPWLDVARTTETRSACLLSCPRSADCHAIALAVAVPPINGADPRQGAVHQGNAQGLF